jgi:two-component system, NarL family, nitrate/nitrite response regulator NarL
MTDVQVVIVDDDPGYRETLEMLFSGTPGHALAGTFASAAEAVAAAPAAGVRWDLAFMDIDMPEMDGIEGTRQLKQLRPELKVVILTVFEDPSIILQAICAGADGYLLKKSSDLDLLAQVELILQDGAPLTARVARTLLTLLRDRVPAQRPPVDLSPRQEAVLLLLVGGHSYKQIAANLGLSLDTVRSHVRGLYRKLQVQNAAAAVTRALREGLV